MRFSSCWMLGGLGTRDWINKINRLTIPVICARHLLQKRVAKNKHKKPLSPREGKEKLKALKDDFIQEVNDAIKDGNVPPKSKKNYLLQRVAASIHVFNYTTAERLERRKPGAPPREIALQTLDRAQRFIEFAETQKEFVLEVRFHAVYQINEFHVSCSFLVLKWLDFDDVLRKWNVKGCVILAWIHFSDVLFTWLFPGYRIPNQFLTWRRTPPATRIWHEESPPSLPW